ncbi:MAG: D-arabinono-1,4-lactone oxidase [Bryobacteraceae bacterium]
MLAPEAVAQTDRPRNLWLATILTSAEANFPTPSLVSFSVPDFTRTSNARPHWAKLFTMAPSPPQSLYEKLPDYRELLKRYDPSGKFRDRFLNTNLYGSWIAAPAHVSSRTASARHDISAEFWIFGDITADVPPP